MSSYEKIAKAQSLRYTEMSNRLDTIYMIYMLCTYIHRCMSKHTCMYTRVTHMCTYTRDLYSNQLDT